MIWTKPVFRQVQKILTAHPSLLHAMDEIRAIDSELTAGSVRDAFRREGFPTPGSYCQQTGLKEWKSKQDARLDKRSRDSEMKLLHFLESLEGFSSRVFTGKVTPQAKLKYRPAERVLFAMISDTHYGTDLLKENTGVLDYGRKEESRRTAAIVQQIIDYKPQYREKTHLRILFLGDMIAGRLHQQRDGATLAEQCARAIHMHTQIVAHGAAHFASVEVYCTTGNHERFKDRHQERAVFEKFDSLATVISYAVKKACSRLTNVTFYIPRTPYFVCEVFDKKILGTHGDTFVTVGNPGKQVKTQPIESQINKINAALRDKEEYSAVVMGHLHTGLQLRLDNGVTLLINPALIPPSDHSVGGCGIIESTCGQWIFESTPDYVVGDTRLITVNDKTDSDVSLDKIISPWDGF